MLAVFTVSIGFGVVLPLLPYLIERLLGADGDAAMVSRSTGLLTAIYTLALFMFAPVWGMLSDRYGRRIVLVTGLAGFGVTTSVFAFVETLVSVYAERFLSGLFAAAVTPVALAVIADLAPTEEARARRLTFVSLAGISGFLLGPMLGVFISRSAAKFLSNTSISGALTIPLAATAVLAFVASALAVAVVPSVKPAEGNSKTCQPSLTASARVMQRLLILAFVVSFGVGAFEVTLALRGKQELGLTQYQIAMMFSECSLVMFVVQAIVFSPWVKPSATRWFVAPAFGVLAAGLFLVSRASDFALMLVVVGAVAASAGILSPILTYWISIKAGATQGIHFGKQTAAASLGGTVGSASGGFLFGVSAVPGGSFAIVTSVTLLGFLLSLGLAKRLLVNPQAPQTPL
ncbi:MFS transporter [Rhizobium leguminosarum]|uniref:MFS transporter n=1 Tax=Rhizobium leguminosarum TaxID=384 RepID=UPI0036DC02FF